MKISSIFVLFVLSSIAYGQLIAAARQFYQPIILSFGVAFAAIKGGKDGKQDVGKEDVKKEDGGKEKSFSKEVSEEDRKFDWDKFYEEYGGMLPIEEEVEKYQKKQAKE